MTVCKHAFHNGVTAYMLQIGESTLYKIFVLWVVFMEEIFSYLNLEPDDGFLPSSMLAWSFNKTGHSLKDIKRVSGLA